MIHPAKIGVAAPSILMINSDTLPQYWVKTYSNATVIPIRKQDFHSTFIAPPFWGRFAASGTSPALNYNKRIITLVATMTTPTTRFSVFASALFAMREAILAQIKVNITHRIRQVMSGIPPMAK